MPVLVENAAEAVVSVAADARGAVRLGGSVRAMRAVTGHVLTSARTVEVITGPAGLACVKAGRPGRFSCLMRGCRLRPGARQAMTEAGYAGLITAAHRYLDAPVIVI